MKYIIGSVTTVAVFALAVIAGAQTVPKGSELKQIKAEVVMKDKAFHITKGETAKGFLLMAGTRADILLRNEDDVAHEFVSTMLYNAPFQLSGTGTFVKAPKAAGVRVDPGQQVVLSFDVPYDGKDFQHIYEVFWCNVHGKAHADMMRGEILIVDQRSET